jgi:DNA-directed RNA polymerase I, II, and III subunit RPABC2
MSKKSKIINEETEEELEETINMDNEESVYEDDDHFDEEDDIVNEELESEHNDCFIGKVIDDDNDYFDNLIDSEIQPEEIEEIILNKEDRISSNRLTKYEMVRILGERTKQLTMGAKPLIKNYETLSYDKIAEEELKNNMIPFKIKRPLPNGKFEIWTLDELMKDHLYSLLDE